MIYPLKEEQIESLHIEFTTYDVLFLVYLTTFLTLINLPHNKLESVTTRIWVSGTVILTICFIENFGHIFITIQCATYKSYETIKFGSFNGATNKIMLSLKALFLCILLREMPCKHKWDSLHWDT